MDFSLLAGSENIFPFLDSSAQIIVSSPTFHNFLFELFKETFPAMENLTSLLGKLYVLYTLYMKWISQICILSSTHPILYHCQ